MNSKINYTASKNAYQVLRAINHPIRQQIIKQLSESSSMNVTDMYVKMKIEQSVASQHLATLRNAGIITAKRSGKQIFYSINAIRVEQVSHLVTELLNTL